MGTSIDSSIICGTCGAPNRVGSDRCVACGARLDDLAHAFSVQEAHEKAPENLDWSWVLWTTLILVGLEAAVLVVAPALIHRYDPQGFAGLLLMIAIWFVGAFAVGLVVRGKAFFEPAIAALIMALPTVAYLMTISDVFQVSLAAGVAGSLLGAMVAMLGSVFGHRVRFGPGA